MFDIGWSELLVIGVIVLFAFGPDDIPKIMYNLGRVMRRFRYMRYALSTQFDDFMQKAEAAGRATPRNSSQQAAPSQNASNPQEIMDDESDADLHLIEMMPVPENVPDKIVVLPEDQNDEPVKPVPSAADRG